MNSYCKICKRENLTTFIEFDKYPKTISNLFVDANKAKQDFAKISFVQCDYCHHVQIAEDMPQEFYEDYIMTVSHSKKMNNFQIEQAEFFIDKFNLANKNVLEVGCGDGNFLSVLKERKVNAFGNEPSTPFRELALKRGLEVDEYFVDEKYMHPNAPFDAVISREVMEHVPEPIEFLKNIRRVLKPEGVALIEVPNFEKALKDLRYYDMFPDHLSYFTRESLTAAMLISGFKNVEIFYGMDAEFIYAIAQNHSVENKKLINAKNKIQLDFEKIFLSYKNIVVWGAGGKGIAAMGSLKDASKIKYVVDSDPFKQDKHLPSSGILVKKPSVLFSDSEVDLLIITNLAYTDEILNILKENNFKSQVKILSPDGITEIENSQHSISL
ncbi:MAG TPA: methyltransferase domain-containing protein [Bacteroidia bacterium]|nr:methyltransferase domain-containing protein [Bacteroidia bacterium]HNU33859.1 methyltransferase domain-containing protein [Bacteroidia bacterium]